MKDRTMRSLIGNPRRIIRSLFAAITLIALAAPGCATVIDRHRLVLVQDGQPRTVIVLPEEPDKREQLAADELTHFLEQISGAKIPIEKFTDAAPDGQTVRILIGPAAEGVIGR